MEGLCVNTIVKSRYRILPANKPGTRLLERKDPNRAIELLEVASLIELQYSPAARSQPVWSAANTSGLACPRGKVLSSSAASFFAATVSPARARASAAVARTSRFGASFKAALA